jgi:tetratricopeptide (TPR) repeat protein
VKRTQEGFGEASEPLLVRTRGGAVKGIVRIGAAAVLAVLLLVAGSIGIGKAIRPDPPPPLREAGSALGSAPLIDAGSAGELVSNLQDRLQAVPGDWQAHADLGLAYVQQARITGDSTYYPKAEEVLERSLELHPGGNFEAMTGMAALAAARHDFSGSLAWARRARDVNPHNANVHAVMGDALVELGRYEEGFDAFQRAVDLRPDVTTYARVSYAWELQGDLEAATDIMELAHQAAGSPTDKAWTSFQLAELAWSRGDLDRAEALYRRTADLDPAYVPAQAGLAKVSAARGRADQAVALYGDVVARYPLPEYVIAFGDLLTSLGREDEARQEYALVDVEARLLRANGVNVDLEVALFDADHGAPADALAVALAEWSRRRGIHVADALAYANEALRLGTRNALFLFHRGVIEDALGREGAARRDLADALALNPHFSVVWADEAASLLASLGGAP